ncbi:MAG TPA: metalloregulator ArsR/SmtB family transcription factor [Acidimicrobiia bacterium]|nr:metalloregulator ArsR/SmtB family transcription factor [Acidimicrobiia bacterium]
MTAAARRQAKDALYAGFATIASALGSGRRVEIVEVLAQGERSVEEIGDELEQSVANTSHHLRTLARAGLVTTRRQGTHVHYRLASESVLEAWLALRHLATERLDDIERLSRDYLGNRDGIDVIDRAELSQRLERGDLVLLDVRPAAEFAAGHIPGAVSLPPDRLDRIDELVGDIPPDLEIAAYCRGPYCVYADDAVRRLTARGRRAMRLEDGFPEWRIDGGAVQK